MYDDSLSVEDRTMIVIALGAEIDSALKVIMERGIVEAWLKDRMDKTNTVYKKFMGVDHPRYADFQLKFVAEKIIVKGFLD